jgi:3-oxoadipate enol-lactonase
MSFGGMVAQEFAVTYPERVERLALLCTSAGGDAGASYPLHELGALSAEERNKKILLLTDSRFTEEWFASHPSDLKMMRLRAEQAAQPKADEVLRGERLQLIARIGHDVADRLHKVASPTFVTDEALRILKGWTDAKQQKEASKKEEVKKESKPFEMFVPNQEFFFSEVWILK